MHDTLSDRYRHFWLPILFVAFNGLACKPRRESSDLQGHFETTHSIESVVKGDLRIVPEYRPTRAVVVSAKLATCFGLRDLIAAILDAGAEVWVLPPPADDTEACHGFSIASDPNLDQSRIKYLSAPVATVWARDWGPLFAQSAVRSKFAGAQVLIDSNYHTSIKQRAAPQYLQGESDADLVPRRLENELKMPRISLPIYHENGNVMCTERLCLFTSHLVNDNQESTLPRFKNGKNLRDDDFAASPGKYFSMVTGVNQELDLVMQLGGGEGTGHIDMIAKFLSNDTVLISELTGDTEGLFSKYRASTKSMQKDGTESHLWWRVPKLKVRTDADAKAWNEYYDSNLVSMQGTLLDLRARMERLKTEGIIKNIETVPLPMPMWDTLLLPSEYVSKYPATGTHEISAEDVKAITAQMEKALLTESSTRTVERNKEDWEIEAFGYDSLMNVFRSYTNSLIVNGTVIVPRYVRPHYDPKKLRLLYWLRGKFYVSDRYPDADLLQTYEARVEAVYRKHFKKVVWINSDSLIALGGAIHCVTMQVPQKIATNGNSDLGVGAK